MIVDGAKISNTYIHATNDESFIPIYTIFNYVKNNRSKRGSGINKRNNNDINNVQTFNPADIITNILESTTDNICNITRKIIMKMNIDNIRKLLIHIATELHNSKTIYQYNEYLLYVVKDICLYKLTCSYNIKIKNKNNKFIILNYKNKLVDKLNLSKLIISNDVHQLFPTNQI